ncbi:group II intron reverse transcriptase/maturase [Granulosicoccus sp. 3-233]|uniref:group II intron reverse transcriptase/maturase n=1 Tax=Granulosicoccus sp. 3-233 TaxID=3417969 RepID=UPI003D325159
MRPETVSTKLHRLAEQAKRHPERVFTTLHHLIDVEFLQEAFLRLRKEAAAGIDNMTAAEYSEGLVQRLTELHLRVHTHRYRAQPVRRVWIGKEDGKRRPLGIPSLEDKILQRAVQMILQPIYEGEFHDHSYGFRPRRSAHQALSRLREGCFDCEVSSIYDADVSHYFDDIDHQQLNHFLDRKVKDGVVRGLINKWLRAGVVDGDSLYYPPDGSPQGGVISPLLSNIYLHYVLDEWFVHEVQPRLHGRAFLVRFADDFVIGCELASDTDRLGVVIPKRFARYGLQIHPEKTRQVPFWRPSKRMTHRSGLGTFDFLGFTHYWGKARSGHWVVKRKTASNRLRRSLRALWTWCRNNRHIRVHEQHQTLSRKLQGHYGYYGIRSNYKMLEVVYEQTLRTWRRWLGKRSSKGYLKIKAFAKFLERYPLPLPRVVHAI